VISIQLGGEADTAVNALPGNFMGNTKTSDRDGCTLLYMRDRRY
jgi:hypothetical protein